MGLACQNRSQTGPIPGSTRAVRGSTRTHSNPGHQKRSQPHLTAGSGRSDRSWPPRRRSQARQNRSRMPWSMGLRHRPMNWMAPVGPHPASRRPPIPSQSTADCPNRLPANHSLRLVANPGTRADSHRPSRLPSHQNRWTKATGSPLSRHPQQRNRERESRNSIPRCPTKPLPFPCRSPPIREIHHRDVPVVDRMAARPLVSNRALADRSPG